MIERFKDFGRIILGLRDRELSSDHFFSQLSTCDSNHIDNFLNFVRDLDDSFGYKSTQVAVIANGDITNGKLSKKQQPPIINLSVIFEDEDLDVYQEMKLLDNLASWDMENEIRFYGLCTNGSFIFDTGGEGLPFEIAAHFGKQGVINNILRGLKSSRIPFSLLYRTPVLEFPLSNPEHTTSF